MKSKSRLYLVNRLANIPGCTTQWRTLQTVFRDHIEKCIEGGGDAAPSDSINLDREEYTSFDLLEAEIIEESILAFAEIGTLQEYPFSDDIVDWDISERILENVNMPDLFVDNEKTDCDDTWLSHMVSIIVGNLRRYFHRQFGCLKFEVYEGNLMITESMAMIATYRGDFWEITHDRHLNDTGLIAVPTFGEFRTLMRHWQTLYGGRVGDVRNFHYQNDAIYVGRNRERFDGNGSIKLSRVPMGNPYSSLSQRVQKVMPAVGRDIAVHVNDKLSACYAFYLDKVSRLVHNGTTEGPDHWAYLEELQDADVACHCNDWTNTHNPSKYCHGLVLVALAELFAHDGLSVG